MGEQPNPWDLLQPQDATSRHRGAKPCRRCDALQFLAVQTIPLSLSRQWRLMGDVNLPMTGSVLHLSPLREVVTGEACIAYQESRKAQPGPRTGSRSPPRCEGDTDSCPC